MTNAQAKTVSDHVRQLALKLKLLATWVQPLATACAYLQLLVSGRNCLCPDTTTHLVGDNRKFDIQGLF